MFIIDKIFNLKIDTKNKNISNITGLKQFDNNSILNITLLQNSLALDLSNCTVRINFLREDERVLLYMANINNAKEGKVIIKLSPEVLEKAGLVKADISVFDSNLLKITSTTFNMKVDKTIYNDTYFTDKDLDLMQQEYVRENERQKAENARAENELARITKEGQRNSNENTRISNEEARKKAEDTRVAEWNNVKKDATNIKNTLDTTIDTANTANNNLKNTINKADTTTYATRGEVKTLTTQYEDTAKKLIYNTFNKKVELRSYDNPTYIKLVTISNNSTYSNNFSLLNITGSLGEWSSEQAKANINLVISNRDRLFNVGQVIGTLTNVDILVYKENESGTLSVYLKLKGWVSEVSLFYTGTQYKVINQELDGEPQGELIYSLKNNCQLQVISDGIKAPNIDKRLDAIEEALIEKGFDIAKNKLNI